MADGLFGAAVGRRAYLEDEARFGQMAAQTELLQAQTRHQRALIGLNEAQAGAIRRKEDREDKKLRTLQDIANRPAEGGAAAPGDTPDAQFQALASQLTSQAKALTSAGLLEEGEKMVKVASDLHKANVANDAQRALEARRRIQGSLALAKRVESLFAGVSSPQGYADAVMTWRNDPLLSQQKLPEALQTYDPKRMREALAATKAYIEKQKLAVQQADLARRERETQSRIALNATREEVSRGRLKLAQERAERTGKEGGEGPYRGASDDDRSYVRNELKRLGYSFEGEDAAALSYSLADVASQMVKTNKGLTKEEAVSRAIELAKERGDITEQPTPRKGIGPFGYKPKDTFTRPEQRAVPLPDSPDKLKSGTVYRSKSGLLKLWNGQSWVSVAGTNPHRSPPAGNNLADEGDDDE